MNDVYTFLQSAIDRYFDETRLLIDQLTDHILLAEPVQSGRSLGEIVLHIIRSLEYYSRGLITDHWEPLAYNLTTYSSASNIKNLYEDVIHKVKSYLNEISPIALNDVLEDFNHPATKAEVLLEMLEHGIQHRGQILVYFRLLGLEPAKIPYIV
ncbi:MAG: DinB family protein [Promethearchaeota archaeon]